MVAKGGATKSTVITTITDAGAPVPVTQLVGWLSITVISLLIFGFARPAARQLSTKLVSGTSSGRSTQWWVVQLHLAVSSWALFDLVLRLCAYLLLPAKLLWRRHMLPLSKGMFREWIGAVRLVLLSEVYFQSDEEAPDMGWRLPSHEMPSGSADDVHLMPARTGHDSVTRSDRNYWYCVVLASVVVVLCIVISVNTAFICLRARVRSRSMEVSDSQHHESEREERNSYASAGHVMPIGADSDWWGMGEPDDACLDSAEARAEEERWKNFTAQNKNAQCHAVPSSGVSRLLSECWPVLAAVGYASLYAFTGGLPLLMRWVYPTCVTAVSFVSFVI
ncbi:hypothetical protein ERJ75_001822300 [Trypanosoma vivax]|nr:hypothetical protein TRVL_05268 [Trypanosoma vivax]KAH8603395.1 hypothetical protein ERJ75_001822300 [Trypanosoma vivax]